MTVALHVTPRHDLVDHDTSSRESDCVCGPEVRAVTQDDGSMGWLLVHHSLDSTVQGQVRRPPCTRTAHPWCVPARAGRARQGDVVMLVACQLGESSDQFNGR